MPKVMVAEEEDSTRIRASKLVKAVATPSLGAVNCTKPPPVPLLVRHVSIAATPAPYDTIGCVMVALVPLTWYLTLNKASMWAAVKVMVVLLTDIPLVTSVWKSVVCEEPRGEAPDGLVATTRIRPSEGNGRIGVVTSHTILTQSSPTLVDVVSVPAVSSMATVPQTALLMSPV